MPGKKKPRSAAPPEPPPEPTNEPTANPTIARKPRSRVRRWAFRIAAVLLIPALFLGLVELGLRAWGYGYATGFFVELPDQQKLAGNPRFGWRFFPPAIARTPEIFTFPAAKTPETYRIFVLGSSAAQGFPSPSFSFSRFLQVMLQRSYPSQRFEIINTAMVAINSHVLVPIARDCGRQAPDLFIIYEGNNEIVGPYGPGTVFGGFSPSNRFIRMALAVRSMRLGQLFQGFVSKFTSAQRQLTEWKGMEFFLGNPVMVDDPRLEDVVNHFQRNLSDVCSAARDAGSAVFLCTVGVNLRDCPPFGSRHRGDLSASDLAAWGVYYKKGVELEGRGDHRAAIEQFGEALRLDDGFAELPYRLGRCYLAVSADAQALRAFGKARDLDVLRFRTDSRLNNAIRTLASNKQIRLIDIESRMNALSERGGPGHDFFYEHCHMNPRGNYLIAAELFEALKPLLSGRNFTAASEPPASFEECLAQLGYSDWDNCNTQKAMLKLIEEPPFTYQIDHHRELSRVRGETARCMASEATLRPISRRIISEALKRNPGDWNLAKKYAAVCGELDDLDASGEALERVISEYPHDLLARLDLAGVHARKGRLGKAIQGYQSVLDSPFCDPATEAEVLFNRAVVQEQSGNFRAAIADYEASLSRKPGHIKAHTNLGLLLAKQGRLDEAAIHHQAVIRLAPRMSVGYVNLALIYFQQRKWDEMISQLQTSLKYTPGDLSAGLLLAEALGQAGKFDEGIAVFEAILRKVPGLAEAHNGLGSIYLKKGQYDAAIEQFEETIRLKPDYAAAKANLETARKSSK